MNTEIRSDDAPPAFSAYAQAVATPPGVRWLSVSGQVGITPDGTLASTVEGQNEQAWNNVFALLKAGGMAKEDIVDVLAIVTDADGVAPYRVTRDRMLDGHVCGSTMLVCGLAHPDWKVEISVRAAKAD